MAGGREQAAGQGPGRVHPRKGGRGVPARRRDDREGRSGLRRHPRLPPTDQRQRVQDTVFPVKELRDGRLQGHERGMFAGTLRRRHDCYRRKRRFCFGQIERGCLKKGELEKGGHYIGLREAVHQASKLYFPSFQQKLKMCCYTDIIIL